MNLQTIRESLEGFVPGDLVGGMEILEQIQSCDTTGWNQEALEIFNELAEIAEGYVSGKSNNPDEAGSQVLSLLSVLEGQVGTGPNVVAGDEVATKDGPSVDMEVLGSFLAESRNHLDDIEERILKFEKTKDLDLVNDIFRSVHTIKGVSSFLDLLEIKSLAHSMEFLLDDLRTSKLSMDTNLCDVLLESTDALSVMIEELQAWYEEHREEHEAEPLQTQVEIAKLVEHIEAARRGDLAAGPGAEETASGAVKAQDSSDQKPAKSVNLGLLGDFPRPKPPEIPEGYGELFTEEMLQGFVSESSDLLDETENAILALENDTSNLEHIDHAFRAIHTVKGNAGFFQYNDVETLCMTLESFLDTIRQGAHNVGAASITSILTAVDIIRSGLVLPGEEVVGGPNPVPEETPEDSDEEEDDVAGHGIGEILVDMGVAKEEDVEDALRRQQMKIGEILVEKGVAKEDDVQTALKKQEETMKDLPAATKRKRTDLRVDTERLDRLFNMVGELITAEAMVVNNPDLANLNLENFNRAAATLSKVTKEIQEITMSMRMIPLDGLFNKMRRLVRDLSRKFSKDIELLVSGEDTEMDRNVIDEISDPLVHIIRNAIDHGLEGAKERKAAGKTGAGTLRLSARYEGNEIWISIVDDGRGLNSERIIKKATERGIIGDNTRELSQEDIFQLIFEPGFSTAEQVSEISGRGVGMDVVKKNIEKLRGKVSVTSEAGQGTEFILKIPLTLAIIEAIVFTVGDSLFSLPLIDIIEFQKADPSQLVQAERGKYMLNIRNSLFPVIDIGKFYDVESEYEELHEGIMMIAQGHQKRVALRVDSILGTYQLVVKALPEVLGHVKAVSGCSIMGGGEVCLIVDTGSLVGYVLE